MTNLLLEFEEEQRKKLSNKSIDNFGPGDTVSVETNIYEGGVFVRTQIFEGVCIAYNKRGLHTSFVVRKISNNEGVEKRFQLYSSCVNSVKRLRAGDVRRAKLYYLRDRKGRAAKIREKMTLSPKKEAAQGDAAANASK